MKNASLLCLLFLLICFAGFSQAKPAGYGADAASTALKDQATKMSQALLKKDYKTFCHYAYPKLIKMVGGEEKMIQAIAQSMEMIKGQGVEMQGISYDTPGKAFKVGTVWQSSIVQHTIVKIPNSKLTTTSTLLAFSSDNGRNWTFMDTNNKDEATIRKMVPDLSPSITIPPPQKPVQTAQ